MNRLFCRLFVVLFLMGWSTVLWALDAPAISAPADGLTDVYTRVIFKWSSVSDAGKYELQVDTTAAFNSPELVDKVYSSASNQTLYHFRYRTRYYWRMRSISKTADDVTSEWTAVRTFVTLSQVTITSPDDQSGASLYYPEQTFKWKNSYGSTRYTIEVDTVASFDSKVKMRYSSSSSTTSTTDPLSKTISNLYLGCTIYWRIRAYNNNDSSAWSTTASFPTIRRAVAESPKDWDNALTKQTLKWKYQTGLNNVLIELDTTLAFNSPIKRCLNSSGSQSSSCYTTVSNLLFGTDYYWRLRSYHAKDTTDWSEPLHFKTYNFCSLSTPSDGTTGQLTKVYLYFKYHDGVSTYQLQLDTTSSFNSPRRVTKLEGASSESSAYAYFSNLHFGTTYFWRVRECHQKDTSVWSQTRCFTTYYRGALDTPPSDERTGVETKVNLYFTARDGVSTYQQQIDTSLSFSSPLANAKITSGAPSGTCNYHTFSGLLYGTTYYRRVREIHANDTSDWSTPHSFTTYATGSFNTSTSLTNGKKDVELRPKLYYYYRSYIDSNEIQLDTTSRFDSPLCQSYHEVNTSESSAYSRPANNLLYGTTYYWRTREVRKTDCSAWSGVRSFTTLYMSPAATLVSPNNQSLVYCSDSTAFAWHLYEQGLRYTIQVAEQASFDSICQQVTVTDTLAWLPLNKDRSYYWRVQAETALGRAQWSDVWMLSTKDSASLYTLPAPVLTSPTGGVTSAYTRQRFRWDAVEGAGQYVLQIDTTSSFSSPVRISDTLSVNDIYYYHFRFRTRYYWRMQAWSATEVLERSHWSEVRAFTTLSCPSLFIPSHSTDSNGYYKPVQTFQWDTNYGCTKYVLEVDTTASFDSKALVRRTVTTSKTYGQYSDQDYVSEEVRHLYLGCMTYWRVKAYNDADSSLWSETRTFHTLHYAEGRTPDNLVNAWTTQTFYWKRIDGLPHVIIEVDTVATFDSPIKRKETTWAYYDDDAHHEMSKFLFGTTYYWRICYYHDRDTTDWSRTLTFTTYDFCTLSAPADSATNIITSTYVSWERSKGVYYYQVQLDTTPSFDSPLLDDHIEWVADNSDPAYLFKQYRFGTTYFWRVRECHQNDTSKWSPVRRFTTYYRGAHGSSPVDGATGLSIKPTLYAEYTTRISTYLMELDTVATFDSPLVRQQTISASESSAAKWTITNDLLYGTTYYWRVADAHEKDTSYWSYPWTFTTVYQMFSPALVTPLNQTLAANDSVVTFVWNRCEEANKYIFQLADNGQFSPYLHQEVLADTSTHLVPPTNSILYWRVQAVNNLGRSEWSQIWGVNTGNVCTSFPQTPTSTRVVKRLRDGRLEILIDDRIYTILGYEY